MARKRKRKAAPRKRKAAKRKAAPRKRKAAKRKASWSKLSIKARVARACRDAATGRFTFDRRCG